MGPSGLAELDQVRTCGVECEYGQPVSSILSNLQLLYTYKHVVRQDVRIHMQHARHG